MSEKISEEILIKQNENIFEDILEDISKRKVKYISKDFFF